MKKLTLLLLACVFTFAPKVTDAAQCNQEARKVLLEYLEIDAKGGRMQKWEGENFLRHWKQEPGWDVAAAINGYAITRERCDDHNCRFEVTYDYVPVKGRPELEDHPDGGAETEIYLMSCEDEEGKWLIDDMVKPHVYMEILEAHIKKEHDSEPR